MISAAKKTPLGEPQFTYKTTGFLGKVAKLMHFASAEMTFRATNDSPDDWVRVTYDSARFRFTLDDGQSFDERALSYGQKRLLSFLYYAAANPDIVVADELVNGLHYEWIDACLDEIKDRQSFLTSQSPLLLDFLPFSDIESVERAFLLCNVAGPGARRHFVWQNMTRAQAEDFHSAYRTRALQVSEILRTSGLW